MDVSICAASIPRWVLNLDLSHVHLVVNVHMVLQPWGFIIVVVILTTHLNIGMAQSFLRSDILKSGGTASRIIAVVSVGVERPSHGGDYHRGVSPWRHPLRIAAAVRWLVIICVA